ncbi:mitochondrial import translocase, subunit Tom22 [Aulographum hederae CBS 113979]|uniref:Mitochondrial import translocase, subunit Tom22 n=1 Tax=Aulographum hederae CBS 113979 TaxID=1176131 RepID=A0A6G1GR02_9PEZI|nr:mitochondrial import translocase, subunit Tom22 [Aulographum hederae CBS 113979]
MVKLEEVADEEFTRDQPGPVDDAEGDWDTDSESDTSSLASDNLDETLLDRLTALKDIVPASTRRSLSSVGANTYAYGATGASWLGKALWVVSTSALLMGVPWALAYAEEQQMVEMEREMKAQQQASEMLGGTGASQQPLQAKPAL